MDNRRNSDRDKILEEILDNVTSDRKKASSAGISSKNVNQKAVVKGRKAVSQAYTQSAAIPAHNENNKTIDPVLPDKTRPDQMDNVTDKKNNTTLKSSDKSKSESEDSKARNKENKKASKEKASVHTIAQDKPTARDIIEHTIQTDAFKDIPVEMGSYSPDNNTDRIKTATNPINKTHAAKATKRKKKRKKNSARLPVVLILTTLIVTISVVLSIMIIAVGRDMLAIGKGDSLKMITIPHGATTKDVAKILEDEDIIDIPRAFEIFAKFNGSDDAFIPGQYEISSGDAYETIINKLIKGKDENRETVDITFVEGISVYDAAKLLQEKKVCDAERFLYYFNAGGFGFKFEEQLPKSTANKFYRMEGYLWPDTYKFYVDSEPESVCMKIYQNFQDKMKPEYYTQMKKMGMTLDEVITLASIVQAEAPDAKSMKMVASVFENRLADPDKYPKLQSSPTTYYVEEIIKPNMQIESTAICDAYDTDKANGLPPGAIGNPGQDAIEAVLYPSKTDYYFFAADIDTKEIYYAKTNEEHEENLAEINGTSTDEDEENAEEGYNEDEYYE